MFYYNVFILTLISCVNGQNNSVEVLTTYDYDDKCDTSDLQVDSFKLNAFVHQYAESASISENEDQELIYLPKKVYDTAMYLIGATKFSDSAYGVTCIGTYPNLVFEILGRELHIPQKYYVDQGTRDSNLCKVLLDYKADDQSYEFPRRFRTNICRLL